MRTWTLQKGFPLVTVQRKGKQILVQQERFSLNVKPEIQPSDARWEPTVSPAISLVPKKGSAKERADCCTAAFTSHASKVVLQILQARLQQYMNREFPNVRAAFRKRGRSRDQIANIRWIIEKKRKFQKNIYFCFIDYMKDFLYITTNCRKFLKGWEYQTTLPASWDTCMQVRKQQLEPGMKNRLVPNWERSMSSCILSPWLFNLYAEYITWNAGLDETQAGIKIAERNMNDLRYADDTILMAESEEVLRSFLMKVKEESEKIGLKLNIQKTKIMPSGPITSWEIDGETEETVTDVILGGGVQNLCRWWLQPWN